MGQLEHIPNSLDSSMQVGLMDRGISDTAAQQMSKPNINMGLMGAGSTGVSSQQISVSNSQAQFMEQNNVPQMIPVSNLHMSQMETVFNRQLDAMQNLFNNGGSQKALILSKRKEPMETTSNLPQNLLAPNKRVAQAEHRPWLQQISGPNKLPVQMQPMSNTSISPRPQPPPPKRSVIDEKMKKEKLQGKTGQHILSVQKSQTGQMQQSPKAQNESESVRSKLRESLAAALALVSQEQQDKTSSIRKNSQSDGANTRAQKQESSQPSGHPSGRADAADNISRESRESMPKKDTLGQNYTNSLNKSQDTFTDGKVGESAPVSTNNGEGFPPNIVLRDEDVTFSDSLFVKDELLQGNGLSWVLEPDTGVAEQKDVETAPKLPDRQDLGGDCGEQAVETETPEILAFKIEAELFKLFGGVNKKYKEKGRSLLFNLKDRNNPELKERVMMGEIHPEKLCSMTAEELASKELSEWRMAKAEEFAQMVVLPDSDIDIRRLVKKTHKGEFQVEVEQQDSISVEVATGASSLPRMPPKSKENRASPRSKPDKAEVKMNADGGKNNLEQDVPYTLTIPSSEGTDLLQGLMVDDELKDAAFLPPIVSLDEFMESLNSEPPFDNLPVDAEKTTSTSEKDESSLASESKSPDVTSKDCVDATSESNKLENAEVIKASLGTHGKSSNGNIKSETIPSATTPKVEHLWEGLLQLSISSTVSVIGIFKCGEKTSVKEWPDFIDIKGRVRLEAFEKFLQELPMSRSRAVMAVHFASKEGSSESERASICEVADSYVLDGRVGLAEPAPGVELYFCPPHSKTREMLTKVLPKDQFDALNAINNGLIGVVVWRKAHITSAASPNSSSHHKHNSKKQHYSSRRQQEKDTNMNVNMTQRNPTPRGGVPTFPQSQPDDDDDDVPPGFGPPAGRDDDDLPEFNFSSGSITPRAQFSSQNTNRGPGMAPFNSRTQNSSRPVDQMRELVHRYGQPKTSVSSGNWQEIRGISVQPWNDDDDDMPEWNPDETQHPHRPPPVHMHGLQQPMQRTHIVQQSAHQHVAPLGTLHPQMNVMHAQHGAAPLLQQGAWMAPPGFPAYQSSGGQYCGVPGQQGIAWRNDTPKSSRGF